MNTPLRLQWALVDAVSTAQTWLIPAEVWTKAGEFKAFTAPDTFNLKEDGWIHVCTVSVPEPKEEP